MLPFQTVNKVVCYYEAEYCHYNKKLARLLFVFAVVPQVLSTKPTTIVNNSLRRPHSLSDTKVEQETLLVFERVLHLKREYIDGASGE